MATQLDLQEQEQLEDVKAFWKQYGTLITWLLVLVCGAYAAWNGWNYWQRSQAQKATAMHDELVRAVEAGDVDRAARVFNDLKERYPRTAPAEQGALAAAKLQYDKGQPDAALATLAWVADNAAEDEYRSVARLRAAGLLLDKQQYDAALKQLDAIKGTPSFDALVADRRGDVLLAQNKPAEAKAAYQAAWNTMDDKIEYRRLIEAKLLALGVAPATSGAGS